jgi:Mrp family chromosome partitioning ATPase
VSQKRGRFGEGPQMPAGARGAAPLPLVTQPIVAIDDPGATRVDNPLAPAVMFTKATALVPAQHKPAAPAGPPPEIGLTQHSLPQDEDPDPRLQLVIDPDGDRSAAFRVLRHHLLELGRPQVIIVSSPLAGEGKTTVALNLALALAECGRAKVLLAEANLRHPQLANVFSVVPPWCFAEQLAAHRNQPMLPWSLVEVPQVWLHLAAISPRVEKKQLLDAPAFAIAMERLRLGGYDHIVIDAPPVLGSADVNLMADAADGVVLALHARHSTTRDLRRAVEQIGASRVLGTVLVQ